LYKLARVHTTTARICIYIYNPGTYLQKYSAF
jgi:hypothetical protein